MRQLTRHHRRAAPIVAPPQPMMVRRAYACGQPALAGKGGAESHSQWLAQQSRLTEWTAPAIARDILREPSHPLEPNVRAQMESRLGHAFNHVRIHSDGKAGAAARSVNALAYTVGNDVVFGAGKFAPGSSDGDLLLAHELTHVIQQGGGATRQPIPSVLPIGDPNDKLEAEARISAANLGSGARFKSAVSPAMATLAVQRV